MLVNELKKIFEVSSILGKGFSPITEFTYVKDNTIKATDMESFLELKSDTTIPFNGCVLTEGLSKFLSAMDKNVDLKFTYNKNTLTVNYGKKNKFTLPMEDLDTFPDSPSLKYSEKDFLCNIALSLDFIKTLDNASKFISKNDATFCGVYLKDNKMYSSNREILFINDMDITYSNSIFIPYSFIKLLLKFKGVFKTLEVYSCGFKAIGDNITLYSSNYEQQNCPDFENLMKKYSPAFEINPTEEMRQVINRISLFDEVMNVTIKDNAITMYTPNINETVDIEIPNKAEEINFRITVSYLKKILELDIFSVLSKENVINAIQGRSGTTTILSTLID